ncbi:uncharacterized protein [Primulina huaijiensis]|uniref:uncharacterized protein isoform X2 n=1 Tax=Primulina huaijiensis TaxID=1492673 RepID=UPI003CC74C26
MVFLNCFCASWRNKKDTTSGGENRSSSPIENGKNSKTLQVKLEHPQKSPETFELRSTSFTVPVPFHVPRSSSCNIKVTNDDSPLAADRGEVHYEGGDEHEDATLQMKRENSDFNLVSCFVNSNEEMIDMDFDDTCDKMQNDDIEEVFEVIASGHVSDPGTGKVEFLASPKLKRSCSDLIMRKSYQELAEHLHPAKSKSYEDMQRLTERFRESIFEGDATSPFTVTTQRSADKVILKKHSSSQILPSRSRRLWWKLFLWSHRNLHRSSSEKPQPSYIKTAVNLEGGYSSDTIEPKRGIQLSKFGLPISESNEVIDKGDCDDLNDQRWDGLYGVSGMWPQNQWVAFPTESSSPLARVDEWVKEILVLPPCQIENDDFIGDGVDFPPSPDNGGESSSTRRPTISIPEDISHAKIVIQSLNASSTVAHMTGIMLKIIPPISHLSSLRSVNLSGNLIAHITPGSLPKGLHVLNLSKNKINVIEGLRELTRLRVIDLSYNRISRIGQGLSKCTLVKELYLTGNKISHVEGLHRLLKLTVLDLSFNKITTTKALGQLVANCNSLIALNLLGNLVHSNIGDDQLRKTMCGILLKLAFLNKQPINSQKAREIRTDAIAKVVGDSSRRNVKRKATKRVSQGTSSGSGSRRRSSATAAQTSRLRSGSRPRNHHAFKDDL